MAHLVSTDRERLLAYGREVGLPASRLQFKPLKDPRSGIRRNAWHWDLVGRYLPPRQPDQPTATSYSPISEPTTDPADYTASD